MPFGGKSDRAVSVSQKFPNLPAGGERLSATCRPGRDLGADGLNEVGHRCDDKAFWASGFVLDS
jgi:hypothetical protein